MTEIGTFMGIIGYAKPEFGNVIWNAIVMEVIYSRNVSAKGKKYKNITTQIYNL